MNYSKIMLSLFGFLLVLSSCNDDYLDLKPLDAISSDAYWKTTNDLKIYANQFYTKFRTASGYSGIPWWSDDNSDVLINALGQNRILNGTRTVPSSGAGWSFSDIRSANYFLENFSTVESDPADYNHYVGEVHFFRALFYFQRLMDFGDFPIIEKTLNSSSEELYNPRNARNEVADFIISDLDKAIDLMVSGVNSNGNRLNREIALLLKARVALYEGTWEKYHANTVFGVDGADGVKYLQLAVKATEELVESGIYQIKPYTDRWTYKNLFGVNDYSGNSEIMLWKQYDFGVGLSHQNLYYLVRGNGGYHGITKSLVDSYLCTDGKPISKSSLYLGDNSTEQVVTNRDPRLEQTIMVKNHPMEVDGVDTTIRFEKSALDQSGTFICPTGYQIFKGINWTNPHQGNSDITASIVFRYAEALLILAEAKAELGTITQEDLDKTINQLRDRVNMPHLILDEIENDPNWDFPSLSPIINEIRRERLVELALEGFRLDDLFRWRAHEIFAGTRPLGIRFEPVQSDYPTLVIGESVILNDDGYVDYYQSVYGEDGYGFDPERDYLAPIPTNELTLNENLIQNPGW